MYTNTEYAKIMTGDPAARKKLISVMDKYSDDRWWIAENTNRLAYMQMQEDTMIVNSEAWQKAVEQLLGREISFFELRMNFPEIKRQVIDAYENKYGGF